MSPGRIEWPSAVAALPAQYRARADDLQRFSAAAAEAFRECAERAEAALAAGGDSSRVPARESQLEEPAELPTIARDKLYTARETATFLGFGRRVKTVYTIPERELVPTRTGPRRGRKMYRGEDILAYAERGRRAAAH